MFEKFLHWLIPKHRHNGVSYPNLTKEHEKKLEDRFKKDAERQAEGEKRLIEDRTYIDKIKVLTEKLNSKPKDKDVPKEHYG